MAWENVIVSSGNRGGHSATAEGVRVTIRAADKKTGRLAANFRLGPDVVSAMKWQGGDRLTIDFDRENRRIRIRRIAPTSKERSNALYLRAAEKSAVLAYSLSSLHVDLVPILKMVALKNHGVIDWHVLDSACVLDVAP